MTKPSFHDEISLAEEAERMAKEAMKQGLISSFTVHHYPDSWQFFIPITEETELLTPEEAYLRLKKLLSSSSAGS
ncbi:MAG: hypothetical protein ACFB4I_07735 [Cyanophyceae cyanobacterium]